MSAMLHDFSRPTWRCNAQTAQTLSRWRVHGCSRPAITREPTCNAIVSNPALLHAQVTLAAATRLTRCQRHPTGVCRHREFEDKNADTKSYVIGMLEDKNADTKSYVMEMFAVSLP